MSGPLDAHLHALQKELDEVGATTMLRLGEGALPDQLYVEMEPDAKQRILQVQAMFLPGGLEIPVLQVYVGLPYLIDDDAKATLWRVLHLVNANTPVGEFGHIERAGLLYYRYNAAVRTEPFDGELAVSSIAMASYLVTELGSLIEQVAGGLDFEAAEEALSTVVSRADEQTSKR